MSAPGAHSSKDGNYFIIKLLIVARSCANHGSIYYNISDYCILRNVNKFNTLSVKSSSAKSDENKNFYQRIFFADENFKIVLFFLQ